MLVSLEEIKIYLGISADDSSQDAFLTQQEEIISGAVEGYCGRVFSEKSWLQTFYKEDFETQEKGQLMLFHYPLLEVTSISDGEEDILEDTRIHIDTGILKNKSGFFRFGDTIEVEYDSGFETLPSPVSLVILSLVQERYNKKQSGVSLSFGSDVQRISIPGTISIDFDYSLQANERKTAFGTILGNFVNVLDAYRSERAVIGSGKLEYVSEASP